MTPRLALLREFLDRVWSSGEIDRCDQFLAAEYTIQHDPGDPWDGQTLTLEGFKERVRLSRAPFPDQRFELLEAFESDSGIAITCLWSATHQGDLPGFPATGRPLQMSGATIYRFDEANRLTGHRQITDRLGIFRQLQEAKPPPTHPA